MVSERPFIGSEKFLFGADRASLAEESRLPLVTRFFNSSFSIPVLRSFSFSRCARRAKNLIILPFSCRVLQLVLSGVRSTERRHRENASIALIAYNPPFSLLSVLGCSIMVHSSKWFSPFFLFYKCFQNAFKMPFENCFRILRIGRIEREKLLIAEFNGSLWRSKKSSWWPD